VSDVDVLMNKFEAIKHRGKLDNALVCSAINNVCGDKLTFYLDVGKSGIIENVKFSGVGCALSQVTADQLSEYIIGKKINELNKLTFEDAVRGIGVQPIPARVKCITTSLTALKSLTKDN